jgi:uncharacterized damage-inducible protein DinB
MNPPDDQNKVIDLFKQGYDILEKSIAGSSDKELDYAPSSSGWTIRQIVHHLVDGDDLWKIGIKIALGDQQVEFSLKWYLALPQTEWAKKWGYENRSIDISLALFKANREHIIQLLETIPDSWTKSVQFIEPDDKIEIVPVGFVIQMQADHVVHHVIRIAEIRKEFSGN